MVKVTELQYMGKLALFEDRTSIINVYLVRNL